MRPTRIWDDVRALIDAGETPTIKLTKANKVIERRLGNRGSIRMVRCGVTDIGGEPPRGIDCDVATEDASAS